MKRARIPGDETGSNEERDRIVATLSQAILALKKVNNESLYEASNLCQTARQGMIALLYHKKELPLPPPAVTVADQFDQLDRPQVLALAKQLGQRTACRGFKFDEGDQTSLIVEALKEHHTRSGFALPLHKPCLLPGSTSVSHGTPWSAALPFLCNREQLFAAMVSMPWKEAASEIIRARFNTAFPDYNSTTDCEYEYWQPHSLSIGVMSYYLQKLGSAFEYEESVRSVYDMRSRRSSLEDSDDCYLGFEESEHGIAPDQLQKVQLLHLATEVFCLRLIGMQDDDKDTGIEFELDTDVGSFRLLHHAAMKTRGRCERHQMIQDGDGPEAILADLIKDPLRYVKLHTQLDEEDTPARSVPNGGGWELGEYGCTCECSCCCTCEGECEGECRDRCQCTCSCGCLKYFDPGATHMWAPPHDSYTHMELKLHGVDHARAFFDRKGKGRALQFETWRLTLKPTRSLRHRGNLPGGSGDPGDPCLLNTHIPDTAWAPYCYWSDPCAQYPIDYEHEHEHGVIKSIEFWDRGSCWASRQHAGGFSQY
jgi:hypothetical protein